ncbi:putative gametogenetin-binding protein 1 [Aotus nancymaae]|uniref:putative gametogenetin-binding protein 1 n=1 Tax=Aotus nancymaae TaxID=37293 RepID=UPI0030FE05A9
MAKLPLQEGSPSEKSKEEKMKDKDSSFKLCAPGTVAVQCRIFRTTDTVGFLESELKKLLGMQQESRLWKLGGQEGRELLAWPEITLEEAGIVGDQYLFFEEKDKMGNWSPECSRCWPQV